MSRMFPTMVSDPNDRNRRYTGQVGDAWPRPLRIGYYLCLAAAVLMLVIGFAQLAAGTPENFDPASGSKFMLNVRVLAWGNIVFAIGLTCAAAYFSKGTSGARTWASVFIGLTIFLNLAGFFVNVAGWASFAVVIVLVFALFFMFRPEANAFVDAKAGNLWEGIE